MWFTPLRYGLAQDGQCRVAILGRAENAGPCKLHGAIAQAINGAVAESESAVIRPLPPLAIFMSARPKPQRQRRCSQSHCSGYSRTQRSTTDVIACMVPVRLISPLASRTGAIPSVISATKLLPSGLRITRKPVNWASGLSRQLRDQRIGHAAPAEEDHFDAFGVMLIDQHADMRAGIREPRHLHRRGKAVRYQVAHQRLAHLDDHVADRSDIRPPIEDARIGAERLGNDSRKLPVGKMRGEAEDGVAARRHGVVADFGFQRVGDDVGCLPAEIGDAELVRDGRTQPRCGQDLFQTPARIFLISSSDFCGKAALRFSRPTRCSGRNGPIRRTRAPAKSALRLRSRRLIPLRKPATSAPTIEIQKNLCAAPLGHQRMIRKSGRRFSEKIMRHQKYQSPRRIRTRR